MKKNYPKLDPKTGRFLPLKKGEKPEKMIGKEIELDIKFEDDYKKLYMTGELGQKRFSKRWGVGNKSLIFGRSHRGGRRSWVQMLDLPTYNNSTEAIAVTPSLMCELCESSDVSLDNAHWVENSNSGDTKSHNILKLCPNCHRKLDRADQDTTENARATLLLRVVKKILNLGYKEKDLKIKLLSQVEPIILHRRKTT